MGDIPPPTSLGDFATQGTPSNFRGPGASESPTSFLHGPSPVSHQHQAFQPQYQRQFDASQNGMYPTQFETNQHQAAGGRPGPYNMNALANALPQSGYQPNYSPSGRQRYSGGASQGQASMQTMPAVAHYAPSQANMNALAEQQYYMSQPAQMQQFYGNQLQQAQQPANLPQRANLGFYPNQVLMNQTQQHQVPGGYYYAQPGHFPGQNAAVPGQMMPNPYMSVDAGGVSAAGPGEQAGTVGPSKAPEVATDSRSNVVRGPPRKPRQSGHAIWIGNLPPQTDLMNLVHHVCKEAPGLESLFLISKSNCAFANFKDEESCQHAQQKLHDSRFQSVRLVSRLRKNTVEGASGQTAPTGPAATSPSVQASSTETTASIATTAGQASSSSSSPPDEADMKGAPVGGEHAGPKDKFFVLKSLTVEDLELSVRNGVWATQSHNEEALNNAFRVVDNVYLVFSANKSGEYFGYARMTSPINDDPAAAIEFAPKAQAASDGEGPRAIPTEGGENCPRGRIIDDSARGTIFWERERTEGEEQEEEARGGDEAAGFSQGQGQDGPEAGSGKAWGKPFKLEWLSTTKLPFYRTRGLRNPWNSNREVKIARDGTELEPTVGTRLIGLFNRVQSPPAATPAPMGMRPGVPMASGYPPAMRPPYQPHYRV